MTDAALRAHDVRAYQRAHRERPWPSLTTVYGVAVAAALAAVLGHRLVVAAVGGGLSAGTTGTLGPMLLALVLLAALRFGLWQGPVSFTPADVLLVLLAPVSIAALVRPKLEHALLGAALSGAVVAVVVVLLSAGGLSAVGVGRVVGTIVSLAAFGTLAVAVSWLVQSSRDLAARLQRAGPWALLVPAALLAAAAVSATGRTIAAWSGPWGWATAALTGRGGWPLALLLMALIAGAAVIVARHRTAAVGPADFLARASTRAQLGTAVFTLDYRGAALARRGALPRAAGAGNGERRLPRPRRAAWTVAWRDGTALIRDPWRVLAAGLLGAAGVAEAATHPGRVLPAILTAIALYAAAAWLEESLRLDVDSPTRARMLLARPLGRLLVEHCLMPALVLVTATALTLAGLVAGSVVAPLALLLVPSVVIGAVAIAVLATALAARRGGRVDADTLTRLLTIDPSSPGSLLAVVWLAPWLLGATALLTAAIALLGHAAATDHGVLAAVVAITVVTFVISSVGAWWLWTRSEADR